MTRRLLTALVLFAFLAMLAAPSLTPTLAKHHKEGEHKGKAEEAKEAPCNVAPEGWTALFDGKSIEGWVIKSGFCTYEVNDGMITGHTAKGSGNTFLCTPNEYGDFELMFDVLLHDNGLNSGVQVRSKVIKDHDNKWGGRIGGPQVEISANQQAGFVYGEGGLGGWWSKDVKNKKHKHFKNGEWNTYHVIAKGDNIKTFINGNQVADMTTPEKYREQFKKGVIGLQVHSVGGDPKWRVSWKNIYIKELTGE